MWARRNCEWSLACQGHRDNSIWRDPTRRSETQVTRAMKSTSCQRRRDDNESEDNRLGDASHRSRPRRMRSVKPNCLHDKSSVSSVASRLCFSALVGRTCVYARSRSRSWHGSSVIHYMWDERTVSLSFSVWFVRISGCRHARLTIAASANREKRRLRPEKLKHCVTYCCGHNRFLALRYYY